MASTFERSSTILLEVIRVKSLVTVPGFYRSVSVWVLWGAAVGNSIEVVVSLVCLSNTLEQCVGNYTIVE